MTNYRYDLKGNLTQLTNPQGETSAFVLDRHGRVVQKTLGNGVVEMHTFNNVGQETNIVQRNAAGTTLASFALTYDAVGRKTSVTEADGNVVSYSYDALGQLLSETRTGTNPYSIAYTYDALGNRLTKTANGMQTSYLYDAANQLQSEQTGQSSTAYLYDPNGNLTQKSQGSGTTTYGWNPQNYLIAVTRPNGTSESYTYCGEGIRRTKTGPDGFRRFIRDGKNILLEVADTGGTLRRYTHQSDEWGTLVSLRQGSSSRYYGFDGSANTRVLTDDNGGVSDAYLYSAFGEELQATGTSSNPLRFGGEVGYYRDDPDRLYVRARHLDVNAGRWLSRDPVGFQGGWNTYAYSKGNPIGSIDPSGLQATAQAGVAVEGGEVAVEGGLAELGPGGWFVLGLLGIAKGSQYVYNAVDQEELHYYQTHSPSTSPCPRVRPNCQAEHERVKTTCRGSGSIACKEGMKREELAFSLAKLAACLNARENFNHKCWSKLSEEEKKTHEAQVKNILKAIWDCRAIMMSGKRPSHYKWRT